MMAEYTGGDPVAGVIRIGAACEDGCDDPPVRVDGGAARVARPHVSAEACNDALHRAAVVSVARDNTLCRPGAGRLDVERTVLGEPDHGRGLARPGHCKAQRGQVESVYAQDGYVVLLVEDDDLGRQEPS